MSKKHLFVMIFTLVSITNISYTQETSEESKKSSSNPLLGGWVVYDQQLGGLNNEFFTIGGVSTGISILGIALGLGVYGSYPFNPKDNYFDDGFQYYYGGLILGYKSVWKVVGVRLFTLLGAASTESEFDKFRMYLVIAPSLHIDLHVYKSLVISLGITYRYHYNKDGIYAHNINDWKNSLSGTASIGWVY